MIKGNPMHKSKTLHRIPYFHIRLSNQQFIEQTEVFSLKELGSFLQLEIHKPQWLHEHSKIHSLIDLLQET